MAFCNGQIVGKDPNIALVPKACGSYADRPWFCLRSKPRQEPIAVSELRNQGFPALFPLRASGKGIEGLFPGYLFAQPLDDGFWSPMRHTRGVADILMNGLTPARVPAQAMEAIRARLSEDNILWPEPSRQVGEGVRFQVDTDHPFAGLIASCTKSSQDRVFALLTIMGRQKEVSFPRNAVYSMETA